MRVTGIRQTSPERFTLEMSDGSEVKTTLEVVTDMMVSPVWWSASCATIDLVCAWLIMITTVYSGAEYFIKNADVFKEAAA